jgi:hypothetical protein
MINLQKSRLIKTFANWKNGLTQYLKIGDLVDEEMVNYFIDVLPPATFNSNLIQIGEPYSHEKDSNGNYRATYSTLKNTCEGWEYCGNCFRGDTKNIEKKIIGKRRF